jgi:hypothetical protein
VTEALQQEIRTLRSLHNSERDPEGRVFAPLADAYRRAGQIPEALRLLNEGLTRLPEFVPGYVVAAELYVEQGLAEEAGVAARRALELDPDNVNALRSLLRVLEDEDEAAEARQVRDHLVALEPDFAAEHSAAATQAVPGSRRPVSAAAQDMVVGDSAQHEGAAPLEIGEAAYGFLPVGLGLDSLELDAEPVFDLDTPGESADGGDDRLDDAHLSEVDLLSPEDPGSTAMATTALPEPEPVFDLGTFAPEEPVLEMAALAPDAPEEPVLEMAALAPDAPEEPVLEMAALAPDAPEEPVLEMAALAPDAPEEPVLEMAALAPDAPEEPVLEMAALAPDAPEEPVLEMAALAPDAPEEPVLEMAALAPDAPEEDDSEGEPVFDPEAVAPLPGARPTREETVDIAFLSPDEPDGIVIDMDALRPDGIEAGSAHEGRETTVELPLHEPTPGLPEADAGAATGGGDETAPDAGAEEGQPEPVAEDPESEEGEAGEPVYSRTLAELYVKQGAVARALGVLRHLHGADPGNRELADRIAQLERGVDAPRAEPSAEKPRDRRAWQPEGPEEERDEEVESLARDLSHAGDEGHDVDTPFAWGEQEPEARGSEGPTILEYFDGMLSWEPGEER